MPFAGIAFLWFIGVVRDGFGRFEDKFFSTVFIGAGLTFLAMMFVAAGVGAGLEASNRIAGDVSAHTVVATFGQMVVLAIAKTYALRMAAVFMISLATIWLKTGLMPRWLVIVTYLVALGLLFASDISMWLTLAFPIWVLVVSLLLLARAGVIDLTTTTNRRSASACDGHSLTASRARSSSSSGTSSTSTTTMPSSSWSKRVSATITQLPAWMQTSRSRCDLHQPTSNDFSP